MNWRSSSRIMIYRNAHHSHNNANTNSDDDNNNYDKEN